MAQGAKEILTEILTLENVSTYRLSPHVDPSQLCPAPLRPFVNVLVCQSQPEPMKINGTEQWGLLQGLEDFMRVVEVILEMPQPYTKLLTRKDLTGEH